MPGALRGEEGRALYGLPGLSPADATKVKVANELLGYMKSFCKYCHRRRVPFYIENPLTSRLWKMPELLELGRLPHTTSLVVDYCQYGEPWRKSTRIMVSRHADVRSLERRCHFGRGYVCSASGKRHVVLSGSSGGTFMTAKAQAYPQKLCRALAWSIREHAVSRFMARFL